MPSLKNINLKGIDYTLDFLPLEGGILAGSVRIHNDTPSEGVTSGALVLTGGLGVSGAIHAGSIVSTGPITIPNPTADGHAVNLKYLADNFLSASGGNIAGIVNFTDTTAATSTTTGAVRIAGGLGVAGAIHAASYTGSGAGLTALNAGNISSGTLAIARGGTGATTAAKALTNFGLTATAAELNFCDGVTSNIQTQLNGKLALTGGTVTGVTTFSNKTASTSTTTGAVKISGGLGVAGNIYGAKVVGAVWNDFAEYRVGDGSAPGRCVCEVGDDSVKMSTRRLQRGGMIVSDTFGFSIGETNKAKTPVAVAGRVLAYTYEDRERYRSAIGQYVCSGPNGTVSLMTNKEIHDYSEAILGIVSAVPDYEEWGTGKVKVDGRVWIKVI